MAKEFKQFDRIVTRGEINECRKKYLYSRVGDINLLQEYNKWPAEIEWWTHDQIRNAVYLALDHYEWQVFRVSMKGLTTQEKIFMLCQWFGDHCIDTEDKTVSDEIYKRNKCRVDNYIGALIRGGQLNTNYEVVK